MALIDALFEFSDAQALRATASATYCLDLQKTDLELGGGNPVYLNVRVATELDSATDTATLTIALVNEADTTIDGTSTVIMQTHAIPEASCTAGAWLWRVALPVDMDRDWGANSGRYLGLYYTVAGEDFTSGNIDAWFDLGPQSSYDLQVSPSNI